jgi:hypothetical protein
MKPSNEARAIAAYMAQRRAAWRYDGRRATDFPAFVVAFCGGAGCSHLDLERLGDRPAPAPTQQQPAAAGAQGDLTGDPR